MLDDGDVLIVWPRRYKPLPQGYRVLWLDCVEHYMAFAPNDDESPIHCNRFWCRDWCFAHAAKALAPATSKEAP